MIDDIESVNREDQRSALDEAEAPKPPPIATLREQFLPVVLGVLLLTVLTGAVFPLVLAGLALIYTIAPA